MQTLKNLRKEKRLTLSAFSDLTGIPPHRVSGIERGRFSPSLEEKLLIERHLGPFTVDEYDGSSTEIMPICPAKLSVAEHLMEANVRTKAELENYFDQQSDDLRKSKVVGYHDAGIARDLYDRFVSATDHSQLKEDQKQRIAELKLEALDFANNIAKKCPPGRLRTKALSNLEAAVDWALKSIVMEF